MQLEAVKMMGGKLQEAEAGELDGKDLISSIIRANKLATSEKDKLADDEVSFFRAFFPSSKVRQYAK